MLYRGTCPFFLDTALYRVTAASGFDMRGMENQRAGGEGNKKNKKREDHT